MRLDVRFADGVRAAHIVFNFSKFHISRLDIATFSGYLAKMYNNDTSNINCNKCIAISELNNGNMMKVYIYDMDRYKETILACMNELYNTLCVDAIFALAYRDIESKQNSKSSNCIVKKYSDLLYGCENAVNIIDAYMENFYEYGNPLGIVN